MNHRERLEFAVRIARAAGRSTLDHFGSRRLDADVKGDGSPVTIADRNAERMLRDMIEDSYPNDAITGEEFGVSSGTSGFRWILDPIDGTRSFVHGVPLYGTLVACQHEDRGIVGVVYIPAMDEIVYGAVGCGAWHQRAGGAIVPARVSACASLREACVCTTGVEYFRVTKTAGAYEALCDAAGLLRGWSDCYAHVLLATGRVDAVLEPHVHVWDVAHLPAILGEAGGTYTNWRGECDVDDSMGVASNGLIHGQLLALLESQGPHASP